MPSPKRERKKQGRQARQEQLLAQQQRARRQRQAFIAVAVVLAVMGVAFLFSRDDKAKAKTVTAGGSSTTTGDTTSTSAPGDTTATSAASPTGTTACPPADGSAERRTSFDGPPPTCIDPAKSYTAKVETDVGGFTVELAAGTAPKTVNNFVTLARYHFYDGVAFHRVIPGFVVQGGDAEKGDGTGGPGYTFADELPKAGAYEIGSLAMANSGPDTNGSQFFVVTGPNGAALPPKYSLFGKVGDGLSVVKKIEADGTDAGTPKTVHKITKITITER